MNAINRKLTDAKEKSFQEKIQSAFQITLKNVGHGNTGGGLVGKLTVHEVHSGHFSLACFVHTRNGSLCIKIDLI